jgi:predicted DNA repair protein MutK
MSGLLALLDDVAAIAKVATASLDDIVGQAAKAGAKAAGAVIDDAAVTPKYVHGFKPDRELPIVWKIARGSIFNKLVILLPAALVLSEFAPQAIAPLLMLGGAYLCFEGAEKVYHWLRPSHVDADADPAAAVSAAHLEEQKVKGAIKTDFILSAEIMTIALSALPLGAGVAFKAVALAIVAVGITALVYGSVALIVKADDVGLRMAKRTSGAIAATGRAIVRGMPGFLRALMIVGTAAMLWVGGSIIVHALAQIGFATPEHVIDGWAAAVATALGTAQGAVAWTTKALVDGVLGLALGFALIPLVTVALRVAGRGH